MRMRNKRGSFTVIGIMILVLLALYMLLHLPIPLFSEIKNLVNYIILILTFALVQIGFIYGYYKIGTLVVKGFRLYRKKIMLWNVNVKNFILTHH